MFLKVSRNSQENTCARVSFLIKLQAEAFCEIFKNSFFYRTPPVAASEKKAIQANLGTFSHNLTYPGIIQTYSGIFRILCYPNIFKTVVYPEPWHIQYQKHIQNPGIFRTPLYSERWHIQNLRHIENPVTHLQWSSQIIIISAKLAVLK